jgi:hypothetical protein
VLVLKQPTLSPTGMSALRELLLPGALLMTMGAQLLAPFMFVDLCFSPFFQ